MPGRYLDPPLQPNYTSVDADTERDTSITVSSSGSDSLSVPDYSAYTSSVSSWSASRSGDSPGCVTRSDTPAPCCSSSSSVTNSLRVKISIRVPSVSGSGSTDSPMGSPSSSSSLRFSPSGSVSPSISSSPSRFMPQSPSTSSTSCSCSSPSHVALSFLDRQVGKYSPSMSQHNLSRRSSVCSLSPTSPTSSSSSSSNPGSVIARRGSAPDASTFQIRGRHRYRRITRKATPEQDGAVIAGGRSVQKSTLVAASVDLSPQSVAAEVEEEPEPEPEPDVALGRHQSDDGDAEVDADADASSHVLCIASNSRCPSIQEDDVHSDAEAEDEAKPEAEASPTTPHFHEDPRVSSKQPSQSQIQPMGPPPLQIETHSNNNTPRSRAINFLPSPPTSPNPRRNRSVSLSVSTSGTTPEVVSESSSTSISTSTSTSSPIARVASLFGRLSKFHFRFRMRAKSVDLGAGANIPVPDQDTAEGNGGGSGNWLARTQSGAIPTMKTFRPSPVQRVAELNRSKSEDTDGNGQVNGCDEESHDVVDEGLEVGRVPSRVARARGARAEASSFGSAQLQASRLHRRRKSTPTLPSDLSQTLASQWRQERQLYKHQESDVKRRWERRLSAENEQAVKRWMIDNDINHDNTHDQPAVVPLPAPARPDTPNPNPDQMDASTSGYEDEESSPLDLSAQWPVFHPSPHPSRPQSRLGSVAPDTASVSVVVSVPSPDGPRDNAAPSPRDSSPRSSAHAPAPAPASAPAIAKPRSSAPPMGRRRANSVCLPQVQLPLDVVTAEDVSLPRSTVRRGSCDSSSMCSLPSDLPGSGADSGSVTARGCGGPISAFSTPQLPTRSRLVQRRSSLQLLLEPELLSSFRRK